MITRSLLCRFDRRVRARRRARRLRRRALAARWPLDYAALRLRRSRPPRRRRERDANAASRPNCSPSRKFARARRSATTSWAAAISRACSPTAVGADGRVYAFQPAEFIAFRAQYGDDQDDGRSQPYDNVVAVCGLRTRAELAGAARHDHHRAELPRPLHRGAPGGHRPNGGAQRSLRRSSRAEPLVVVRPQRARRAPARHRPIRCTASTRRR